MFPQLYVGWTALRAAGASLDVVAQNVANAANPNYHRQTIQFGTTHPAFRDGHWYGSGVDITRIGRVRDGILERAVTENQSLQSRFQAHLGAKRHIESLLTPSEGGITGRVQSLFASFDALSARPEDAVSRRQVVHAARDLALELNRTSRAVNDLRTDLESRIRQVLGDVSTIAGRLVDVQQQISLAEGQGRSPNTLLDQRDALLNELSQYVDTEYHESEGSITIAGGSIIIDRDVRQQIVFQSNAPGTLELVRAGDGAELRTQGGLLHGLLEAYNGLQTHQDKLDELSVSFIRAIDQRHATGIGLDGPFSILTSARRISDVQAALSQAQLPIELQSGELSVTITNSTTGERSVHTIAIDPAGDSLSDVASQLSSIPHLQATVNTATGQLAISAQPGFKFDFTGGAATFASDVSGLAGTTVPSFEGLYTGTTNETYTFEASGPGEIGVTEGLAVIVRNTAGDVVQTLNVGSGYAAGKELEIEDGLKVKFSHGTLMAGDSFGTRAVGNSDTVGILAGLAINTLFVGQGAHDLAVHADVLRNPRRLATALSPQVGDASNLVRMTNARQFLAAENGTATIEQYVANLIADIGDEVQQLNLESESATLIGERLTAERQVVSGVNPDEEIVRMLQFQRSFEAASRFVAAIRDTTGELMNIIR